MNAFAIHRIGPIPSTAKLGEYSLVLRSQEIDHGVSSQPDGYYFTVQDRDVLRSVDALRAYEEENRDFRPAPRVREKLPFEHTNAAMVTMIALAVFFLVTGPVALRSAWFGVGTADSSRILHGEAWRAITALTLHADLSHVLGNVIAGGIFLGLLFRRVGPGRGLFLTVVAGSLANLANAAIHAWMHQPHRSIGASTAVFAAVGLLAASQIAVDFRQSGRRWTDRVGPIVGGLALLGALGSSAQSDLWAHLLGLLVGGIVGLMVLLPAKGRRPVGPRGQVLLGGLAAAAIVSAWIVAFVVHPATW